MNILIMFFCSALGMQSRIFSKKFLAGQRQRKMGRLRLKGSYFFYLGYLNVLPKWSRFLERIKMENIDSKDRIKSKLFLGLCLFVTYSGKREIFEIINFWAYKKKTLQNEPGTLLSKWIYSPCFGSYFVSVN